MSTMHLKNLKTSQALITECKIQRTLHYFQDYNGALFEIIFNDARKCNSQGEKLLNNGAETEGKRMVTQYFTMLTEHPLFSCLSFTFHEPKQANVNEEKG